MINVHYHLHENAPLSTMTRAYPRDAGIDLAASVDAYLNVGEIIAVSTGVYVSIPAGHYGMITSRSGAAARGIIVANAPGVIDAGYTGEIRLLMTTLTGPHRILAGDRIAQLIITPITPVKLVKSTRKDVNCRAASNRRSNGLGSSGL